MGWSPTCPLPAANCPPATARRLLGYLPRYMPTWADPSQISCAALLMNPLPPSSSANLASSCHSPSHSHSHSPSLRPSSFLPLPHAQPSSPSPSIPVHALSLHPPAGSNHRTRASRSVDCPAVPRAVALGLETLLWLRRQPAVGLVTFIALTELNSTRPNPSQRRFFSFLFSPGFCLDLACFAFPRRSVARTGTQDQEHQNVARVSLLLPPAVPGLPNSILPCRLPFICSHFFPSPHGPVAIVTASADESYAIVRAHRSTTDLLTILQAAAYRWCYFPSARLCTAHLFRCSVFFCITTTFTRVRDTPLPQQSWCLFSVHPRRRLVRARS